ncbi:hypothetical protein E5676_scaffold808G00040 [Cucumis melo var. makuwa]|uniref:Uncharacterized protein n=1 Tax=Cucumis melo var. makuwa TaxID=1194695 RepID=A0A5D3BSE0_CUCMM|nr:hypothetical protein E6C27_scaffold277G00300 [Cucumis melo var. makuwa]TYK01918.1 hypothetical protein E5676_scaffold808G00040 [Cucumis melo var. makuwa]
MAYFKSLPRSCKVERKEFVLHLDKYSKHTHYWLTETRAHKAFSIEVSTKDLDWIRCTLKSLIATPNTNRFFLETRDSEQCIWIRKTRNSKGCTAEIFRVDKKNRKSCILVPEGPEKSGWVSFLSMITPKVEVKAKTRPTFLPRSSPDGRLSPPIDYHKRSYARVVTEGRPSATSDSSDSYDSSDSSHSSGNSFYDSPSSDLLENTVVIVRRFFHDDWHKILQNLRKQTEESFTYNAFHAEKALVHFSSNIPANLLCQNKGWTTVGKYSVRFEKWSSAYHATPKLIPSYGGWTTFRGIPLHLWNMTTFQQIGKACGGLIKVAEETRSAKNLIEARIKVRYNYSAFLPANVRIFDNEGNKFSVQVVTHPEGKWLIERNVRLHGTFKRQAAATFDDFNPESEQFFFEGMEAISPDFLSTSSDGRKSSTLDQPSALKSVIIKPDRAATSPSFLNEEVVNDSDLHATANKSKLEILPGISNDGVLDKGKQKVDIQFQPNSALNLDKSKRKVSFNSPCNKTNIFNPDSAPANHSPSLSSPEKKQKVSRERSIKKRLPSTQPNSKTNQKKDVLITQPIQIVAHDREASKKGLSLTVDLGDLPVLDPNKSFEDHHSSDNAEVIDITNTEVVPETPEMKMQVNENSNSSSEANYRKPKHVHKRKYYYRKKEEKEKDPDSEAFKKQLVSWLKENGLKLSTVTDSSGATTSTNVLINQLNFGLASKGIEALGTSIVK